MLVGLFFIVVGYVVPFFCHQWLAAYLSIGIGPVSMAALHRYLTFLECLQLFLVLLGFNLVVVALTRSRAARDPSASSPKAT